MVWILSIPVALLYFFGGKFVLLLFLNTTSEEAIDTGLTYLRILSPFYIFVSAKLVADGILRGMERMKQFMASTFTDLLLRVILASVLSKQFWERQGFGVRGRSDGSLQPAFHSSS